MTEHPNDPDPLRRVGIVVVAAGSGSRLGAGLPKAFAALAGRSLLRHALDRIEQFRAGAAAGAAVPLVIVVPASMAADLAGLHGPEHGLAADVHIVAGGAERGDSVLAGVRALPAEVEVVLVHDAARCLTPAEVFDRVWQAVAAGAPAVVPGIAVVDTIKVVDADGLVLATPDRTGLRAIQTPQGFRRDVLERAHAEHGSLASDDAGLVERLGLPVTVVAGSPAAFKITTPEDLAHAERVLADSTESAGSADSADGRAAVAR